MIAGLVARGEGFGPQALAVSPCGRRVAFVGPSEYTVTVADAKCLDEVRPHFILVDLYLECCLNRFNNCELVVLMVRKLVREGPCKL